MDKQQDKVSFTAGPWSVGEDKNSVISHRVMASDDLYIAGVSGYKHIPFGGGGAVRKMREVKANAHLIAASPCMYEALKKLVALDDERDGLHENTDRIDGWAADYRLAVIQAKAALSKANPNSNLTPSELRDKLDAVEVIGEVS